MIRLTYLYGNAKSIPIDHYSNRNADRVLIIAFIHFQQDWYDQAEVTSNEIPDLIRLRQIEVLGRI